jgi:hypothetical protein
MTAIHLSVPLSLGLDVDQLSKAEALVQNNSGIAAGGCWRLVPQNLRNGRPKFYRDHDSFHSFISANYFRVGRRPVLSKAEALVQNTLGMTADSCRGLVPDHDSFYSLHTDKIPCNLPYCMY